MEPTVIRQEEKRTLPGTHRPVTGNRLRRRRLKGPGGPFPAENPPAIGMLDRFPFHHFLG